MRTDVQSKTHFPKGARVAKVAINFLLVIIPLYQHPLTSATLPSFSSFYLSHPFISWLYLQSLSSFFLEIPASLFFVLPCIFSLFHSLNPLEMFWPTFPSLPFNLFSMPFLLLRNLWSMREAGLFPAVLVGWVASSPAGVCVFSFTGVESTVTFRAGSS